MKLILMALTGLVLMISSNVGFASNVNTKEAITVIENDVDVVDLFIMGTEVSKVTYLNKASEALNFKSMDTILVLGCNPAGIGKTTLAYRIKEILTKDIMLPNVVNLTKAEISENKDINILLINKPVFKELTLFERWEKEYVNSKILTDKSNLFREQDLYEPIAFCNLSPKEIFTNKRKKWVKGNYPKTS